MVGHVEVLIVGGGVIGVCSAHSLAQRGVEVALLERGAVCSGCSHGNAGWIFPSHSFPLAAPGVIRKSLRWLTDPASPLYIKPRLSPTLLGWLWRFRAACGAETARASYGLRRALSLASLARYAELAELPGLEFGFERRGLLVVCRTAAALREVEAEATLLETLGGEVSRHSAAALRERVPALTEDLAGGLWYAAEAHIDPGAFVRALATDVQRRGVVVHTDTEVLRVERWSGGSTRVATTRGDFVAREVVMALGAWTPGLAAMLGLRLPVQAAKGYSITVQRPDGCPDLPLMLAEAKVGVTPLGDRLRFAGTLEFAGLDQSINQRRVRAIETAARSYLPGLPPTETEEIWRGLRPLTPDDLPILGRPSATPGLIVATGHGMTGISHGPITGELVAQLVTGETPSFDLAPLSPDRF